MKLLNNGNQQTPKMQNEWQNKVIGIGVPNQNSIVKGHLYKFHSKAAIIGIIFHNYISKDSSE